MEYDNCFFSGRYSPLFYCSLNASSFFCVSEGNVFFSPRDTIPRHPETRRDPETRLRHLPRHGIPMFLSSNINTFCRHQLLQTKNCSNWPEKCHCHPRAPGMSSPELVAHRRRTTIQFAFETCVDVKKNPNMKRLHLSHRGLSPLILATYMIR